MAAASVTATGADIGGHALGESIRALPRRLLDRIRRHALERLAAEAGKREATAMVAIAAKLAAAPRIPGTTAFPLPGRGPIELDDRPYSARMGLVFAPDLFDARRERPLVFRHSS